MTAKTPHYAQIRRRPLFRGFAALTAVAVFLGAIGPLPAQSVPVPNVTFDAYNPGDWNAIFDAARLSFNQQQFEQIIDAGTYTLAAQWEAAAETRITNETLSVTNSDAFNSVSEYREYLRAELEIQKQDAFATWEAAALTAIDNERDAFLAGLITAQEAQTSAQAQDDLHDVDAADTSDEYRRQRDEYEANYQANIAQGLAEYQAALNAIAADAEAFQQEMAAAELEFQQNLAQIEAFEANVRANIESAVDSLENQLQNSSFFYVQNCDSENVCTATADLTTAGTNLELIIADMRDGLANDADLSTLALTLSTYLAGRETEAIDTRDYWAAEVLTPRNIHTDDGGQNVAGVGVAFDFGTAYGGTLIGAMIEEFGGNTGTLANHLSTGHLVAQNFQNLDLCGSSTLHWPYPLTGLTSNTNECWHGNSAGVGAFSYNAQGCGGPPLVCVWNPLAPNGHPEARVDAHGTYDLYDPNADHNEGVWQGYVDNINLEKATWDGTLIPALQAWEAQVASYTANYSAWQAQVPALLQQNQAAYEARLAAISEERTAFLNRTRSEYEAGLRKIEALESAKLAGEEDLAPLAEEAEAALTASRNLSVTSAAAILDNDVVLSNLPDRAELRGVVSRARELLPDFSATEAVVPAFYRTLQGSYNVALGEHMHAEALSVEADILADIQKQLQSYNDLEVSEADVHRQMLAIMAEEQAERGEEAQDTDSMSDEDVLNVELNWSLLDVTSELELEELREYVRESLEDRRDRLKFEKIEKQADGSYLVTRRVSTGETRLMAGGDATNEDHYIEEFVETTFRIEGAGSVKLAETGDLFADDFNVNQALDDFYGNINSYYKENVTKAFEQMAAKLDQQDTNAITMQERAEESTERQVEFAEDALSLAQTLVTGGTLATFGDNMIRGQMAEVLGQITGMPAGFLSALFGSGDPGQAVKNFVEGELLTQFDAVLGLPAGSGSMLYGLVQGNDKRNTAEFKMGRDMFRNGFSPSSFGYSTFGPVAFLPGIDRAIVQPMSRAVDRMADRVGAFTANHAGAINNVAHLGGIIPPELSLYGYSQRVYDSGGFGKYFGRPNTESTVSQEEFERNQLERAALFAVADQFGLPPGSLQMLQGINLSPETMEAFVINQVSTLWETALGLPTGVLGTMLASIEQHDAHKRDPNYKLGRDLVNNFGLSFLGINMPGLERVSGNIGDRVGRLFARNPMIPQLFFPIVHGSYHGGTRGAVTSGAGLAATALIRAFSLGTVGVNAGYSFQDGYSGGVTVGFGKGDVNLGVGLNYSEVGGWGATAGVTVGGNLGGTLGLSYNEFTGFGVQAGISGINSHGQTGSFGVGWNKLEGYGANVGVGQGSAIFQATYSQNNGFGAGFQLSHAVGAQNAFGDSAIAGGLTFSASTSQYGGNTFGVNYQQTNQFADGPAAFSGGLVYNTLDGLTGTFNASYDGMSANFSANEFTGGAFDVAFGAQPNFITSHDQLTGALAGMQQQQRSDYERERNLRSEALDMERVFGAAGMTAERWLAMDELDRQKFRERNIERITKEMEKNGGEGLTDEEIAGYNESQDGWLGVFSSLGDTLAGVFSNEVYDPNGWRDENGKWHPRTCFLPGTVFSVEDGFSTIEKITVGMMVPSYDPVTGEISSKPVTEVFKNKTDIIFWIEYVDGTRVGTTWNHPFLIEGKDWIEAKDLRPGDRSVTANGSLEIAKIEQEHGEFTVYNVEVADNHTYFVTEQMVVVHNYEQGLLQDAYKWHFDNNTDQQVGTTSNEDGLSNLMRDGRVATDEMVDEYLLSEEGQEFLASEKGQEFLAGEHGQAYLERTGQADSQDSTATASNAQQSSSQQSIANATMADTPPEIANNITPPPAGQTWGDWALDKVNEGWEIVKEYGGKFKDAVSEGVASLGRGIEGAYDFVTSDLGDWFVNDLLADMIPGVREFVTFLKNVRDWVDGNVIGVVGNTLERAVDYIGPFFAAAGWFKKASDAADAAKAADKAGDAARAGDNAGDAVKTGDNVGDAGKAAIEHVSPYKLEPTHGLTLSRAEYAALKEQIRNEGIQESIKIVESNGKRYIVDGHHRLQIAKELGMESVPIEKVKLPYKGYQTVEDLRFE